MNIKTWVLIGLLDLCLSVISESHVLDKQGKHIAIGMECGGRSHVKYLFEISAVLKERGHQITYVTPDHYSQYSSGYNITHYSLGRPKSDPSVERERADTLFNLENQDFLQILAQRFIFDVAVIYEFVFPKYIQYFRDARPDLIICDFFSSACIDAARRENVPLVIGFQSLDLAGVAPSAFITQAFDFTPTTMLSLNFRQRFYHKIMLPIQRYYQNMAGVRKMNQVRAKYQIAKSIKLLADWKNALLIANSFFHLDAPRHLPPNLKLIGPVISQKLTPLSHDLKTVVDQYEHIVLLAFGGHVFLNRIQIQQIMDAVFKALETEIIDAIIWGLGKTRMEDFPESFEYQGQKILRNDIFNRVYPNIRISPWLPQPALLSRPNVRLFISHGGWESVVEAMYHAKPILTYPFVADQLRNGRRVFELGIGDYIDRFKTNQDEIYQKMTKIVLDKDHSIRQNLAKMQMLTQIGSRRKLQAADLIEEYMYLAQICRSFSSRKKEPNNIDIPCEIEHLIPDSQRMPFIKSNGVDVYFLAFAIFSLVLFTLLMTITKVASKLRKLNLTNAFVNSDKEKND